MKKLTKHTNFKDLKSDIQNTKVKLVKDKSLMSEFESFLNLLQNEFSAKKNSKISYGKSSR